MSAKSPGEEGDRMLTKNQLSYSSGLSGNSSSEERMIISSTSSYINKM